MSKDAGKIYITTRSRSGDITRLTADSTEYAHALANVLNDLGYRASHVPATCTIYFNRDVDELSRVNDILDEVVAAKGGLSIVDLKS
jgi:hypothetical protein